MVAAGTEEPFTVDAKHVGGDAVDVPSALPLLASAVQGAEQGPQSWAGCQYRPMHCRASHWEEVAGAARPVLVHAVGSTRDTSPPGCTCVHCTVRVR